MKRDKSSCQRDMRQREKRMVTNLSIYITNPSKRKVIVIMISFLTMIPKKNILIMCFKRKEANVFTNSKVKMENKIICLKYVL